MIPRAWLSVGLALAAVAGAWTAGVLIEDPAQPHAVMSAIERAPRDGLPWEGDTIAVAFLQPLVYNATRDATLMGAFICSHAPCGPLLWVEGNVSGRGPFLLRTDATRLTIERDDIDAPPPPPANGSGPTAFTPGSPAPTFDAERSLYESVDEAIAQTFTATPALPTAIAASLARVAPLLLLAIAPGGVLWWRRAAIAAAVAGGWLLAINARHETWGILGYMFVLGIAFLVALGILAVHAVRARRIQPEALAVLALVLAFFQAIDEIRPYHPVEGGE